MGCGSSSSRAAEIDWIGSQLTDEDIGSDLEAVVSLGDKVLSSDGSFKLQAATYKSTNKDCMVKFRSKSDLGSMARLMSEEDANTAKVALETKVRRELAVLKSFSHQNICNWLGACQTPSEYQLVTEAEDGDLWDQIVGNGSLTESQAVRTLEELSSALATMHTRQLCHRDVKPENVRTSSKGDDGLFSCKLTGFHFARYFGNEKVLTSKVGTPFYVAPQVLISQYDHRCDVWSLGCLAYVALVGYPPFPGKSDEEILAKVAQGNYFFNKSEWQRFSEEAKNLCRGCFKMDVSQRLSMQAASKFVQETWKPTIASA